MKIYFSGSVRGGRGDKEIYAEIIALLKNYGTVLTEHLGDVALSNVGQIHMTDVEIYTKDVNWVRECDIVIAEVTNASLGVGYELGLAESLGKKIVVLYRESDDKMLSVMIAGNSNITCVNYAEVSELPEVFDRIFK